VIANVNGPGNAALPTNQPTTLGFTINVSSCTPPGAQHVPDVSSDTLGAQLRLIVRQLHENVRLCCARQHLLGGRMLRGVQCVSRDSLTRAA
jgi:hypothetical protein